MSTLNSMIPTQSLATSRYFWLLLEHYQLYFLRRRRDALRPSLPHSALHHVATSRATKHAPARRPPRRRRLAVAVPPPCHTCCAAVAAAPLLLLRRCAAAAATPLRRCCCYAAAPLRCRCCITTAPSLPYSCTGAASTQLLRHWATLLLRPALLPQVIIYIDMYETETET